MVHSMYYWWTLLHVCCSGEGGKGRDHRTSIHAAMKILRNEGFFGMYNGLVSIH